MSSQLIASAESVARRAPVGMLEVTTGMREGMVGGRKGQSFRSMGTVCNYPWLATILLSHIANTCVLHTNDSDQDMHAHRAAAATHSPVISDKNNQPCIHQAGDRSKVITAFLQVFTDFLPAFTNEYVRSRVVW